MDVDANANPRRTWLALRAWLIIELKFLHEHSKISECSFKKSQASGTKAKGRFR